MQKLYYSISEVSDIVDEEQHILRYWEKEFEQLKPKKNRGGNRIYSEKDVNLIKTIKKLLRQDKLSLQGAKENLLRILSDSEPNNSAVKKSESHETGLQSKNNVKNTGSEFSSDDINEMKNLLTQMKEFLLAQ